MIINDQLAISEQLDALLMQIPDEAIAMIHDLDNGRNRVTITIDWRLVPGEEQP